MTLKPNPGHFPSYGPRRRRRRGRQFQFWDQFLRFGKLVIGSMKAFKGNAWKHPFAWPGTSQLNNFNLGLVESDSSLVSSDLENFSSARSGWKSWDVYENPSPLSSAVDKWKSVCLSGLIFLNEWNLNLTPNKLEGSLRGNKLDTKRQSQGFFPFDCCRLTNPLGAQK